MTIICYISSCTIHHQSQYQRINEQGYHQDFYPEIRVPNAFIPSENFTHIGFMLGDKPWLFGTMSCQYRSPTFYRMVYELPKLVELFGSEVALKFVSSYALMMALQMLLTILSQLPTAALSVPSMWHSAAMAFSKSSLNFISVSFAYLICTRSLSISDFSASIYWLISIFSSMSLTFMGDFPISIYLFYKRWIICFLC